MQGYPKIKALTNIDTLDTSPDIVPPQKKVQDYHRQ